MSSYILYKTSHYLFLQEYSNCVDNKNYRKVSAAQVVEDSCSSTSGGSKNDKKNVNFQDSGSNFTSFFRSIWNKMSGSVSNSSEQEEYPEFIDQSELTEENIDSPRYRPQSIEALCRATKFSEAEIKKIYRNFKTECPTGTIRQETFKGIYAKFFPYGTFDEKFQFLADIDPSLSRYNNIDLLVNVSRLVERRNVAKTLFDVSSYRYAHYVFNTLDHNKLGYLNFEDFVKGLSVLCRGTLEEKLRWIFCLYDTNGDGVISRDDLYNIVSSVYELMGSYTYSAFDSGVVARRVEFLFQRMDKNKNGQVTLEEFLHLCSHDKDIQNSIQRLTMPPPMI